MCNLNKLDKYFVMGAVVVFLCFPAVVLSEEYPLAPDSPEAEEVIIDMPEIMDTHSGETISLEEYKLGGFPEEKKSNEPAKGKSILNISAPENVALRTPLEAHKLGWKSKTISIPQPVSNLVKEVPKEIKEKKARLKKKLENTKSIKQR